MECSEARRQIAAGMRPGSRSPERRLLGFHLAECPACRAVLDNHAAADDDLLQALLSQPTATEWGAEAAPGRTFGQRLARWGAIALVALLLAGAGGGILWAIAKDTDLQADSAAGDTLAGGGPATIEPPASTSPSATHDVPTPPVSESPAAAGGVALPLPTDVLPTATPPPTRSAPAPTKTPSPTPEPPLQEPVNILLLGLDRRPGEIDVARSDSLIILHLDPVSGTLGMLSLPRDLWVPLPEYGYSVKINAAYQTGERDAGPIGGANEARKAVSTLIGQPIDYTVVTTFEGMMRSVDALGGIEVDVPREIYDGRYPTFDYGYTEAHFLPGPQTMDGPTALMYSRTRHADNDFERGRRQQLVLLAIAAKLRERLKGSNFASATTLIAGLYGDLEYTDLPLPEAMRLARAMRTVDPADVRRDSVDLRYGYETSTSDGAYIIAPDIDAIQRLTASLFEP